MARKQIDIKTMKGTGSAGFMNKRCKNQIEGKKSSISKWQRFKLLCEQIMKKNVERERIKALGNKKVV